MRNSVANFKRTSVPLKLDISFEQRPAITGKVTVLQAFDPANSTIFPPTPSLPSPPPPGSMKGGVTAGRALHKIPPFYPLYAKANHISGAVLLHAIISRQGAVTGIFPIASPDTGLTAAAIDAVKQWTYQPFLLNGQPTDVETTIQVNFNMR